MRRLLASLAALLALTGCETLAYYAQAVTGQLGLLSRAQPVERLISDPATPAPLRQRLALAREIRDYAAKELALPDNESYRSYAELDRPYAVWNVVAAPEFSLEPLKSCFPVAGCVNYRGFFSREAADRYAEGLKAEGNDVFVYGVAAYSTLGRFDDPLLSTFIRYPDTELARLLFHELSHQVAYVKDDSTFNESFAVTVEREGVKRWLEQSGRSGQLAAFLDVQRRNEALMATLDESRRRLRALYTAPLAPEVARERKRKEMQALTERLKAYPRFAEFPANNALLASFATYTQLVPAFQKLLAEEDGNLPRFYERVKQLAKENERPVAPGAADAAKAS
ncbi:MAG TPA: aminopeptidase [Burkholderiales bacterium]|nr:aminopeptidase [Burkholderiales bacterium]